MMLREFIHGLLRLCFFYHGLLELFRLLFRRLVVATHQHCSQ